MNFLKKKIDLIY